jgi:hypothetical protein
MSVVLLLVAVGSGVALVFGAAARGSRGVAVVAVAFVAAFGFGLGVSVPGMRRWIAGQAFPAQIQLLQGAGFVVGLVVLFWVDGPVGGALLAGLFGSVFAVSLWGIRTARANRDAVDAAEAALAREQAPAPDDGRPVPVPSGAVADRAPVGRVLRDLVAVQRRGALGWLLASALGIAACVVLPVPAEATIAVVSVGPLFFLWDLRRLWAVWLALRDFRKGATSPRRAFAVLLHDPAPRMVRPLLGVWSQAPAPRGGRLPSPSRSTGAKRIVTNW